MSSQGFTNLRCTDVLALPPKCIANAIHKPKSPIAIKSHGIPRPEIRIALLQDVAEYFLLGGLLVPKVALKLVPNVLHVEAVEKLARISSEDLFAKPSLGVTVGRFSLPVHLYNRRCSARQELVNES